MLRTGAFQTLLCHDQADVWAFLRADGDEQAVVAINASNEDRIVPVPLPSEAPEHWQVVYGPPRALQISNGTLPIEIPPLSGTVLAAHAAGGGV